MLILLARYGTLHVPKHGRSDVLPYFLRRAREVSTPSSPTEPVLPHLQLDDHRAVIREFFPDGCVGLAVSHVAKGGAIDPGHHPPVDDDVVNEVGKWVVPTADGHVLRHRREVGVSGLAIVQLGPHLVMGPVQPAVEVPSTMNGLGPCAAASIQPSMTGTCAMSVGQAELVVELSKQPLLRCTDIS
jgi:hypothetical protein